MRISDWSSDVCSSDLLLDFATVKARLPENMGEDTWNAIRPNMEKVSQAADWWAIITGPLDAVALELEDRAFAGQAADVLATLSWSDDVWKDLTSRLKEETGRKGKPIFLPERLALTSRNHGLDMATLLHPIGAEWARDHIRDTPGNRKGKAPR